MSELESAIDKHPVPLSGGKAVLNFDALWGATDQTTAGRPKNSTERYSIGDDGLLVERVGPWVSDKHKMVTDYVIASGGARRKYRSRAFIEVFCGPGRALIRDTGQYVDGSAVAAFKAGLRSHGSFTSIEISDARPDLLDAARQRLDRIGAPVHAAAGPARNAVTEIVRRINPYGLHLAFLDPHSIGALSFDLLEELAKLKHVDVMMHVSIADIQRNADR